MASVKVDCVIKANALIGEGPVWEESERSLVFVDIGGQKIHRWDPNTDQIQSMDTGDTVGFAVPRGSGGYVAGVGRKIVAVDWSSQTMTSLTEVDKDKPNNRLNDGKVDPFGRLLTGTMALEVRPAEVERHQGSLYSVAPDLTVTKHLDQVDISNGMDWSLDHKTFFYIDSLALSVDAFDYEPTSGLVGNRRVVYHMEEGEGLPDGMTVDVKGHLWVACYNGGRVINIDPAVGVRLQTVSLPVKKTTSCCFGGPDYRDLYVTSASLGLNQSERREQPLAGNIFRVTGLEVKGRPSHAFSGMDSSSMSLKMVPLIWLGFKATQFNTGNLNFVWIGFFIFTAASPELKMTVGDPPDPGRGGATGGGGGGGIGTVEDSPSVRQGGGGGGGGGGGTLGDGVLYDLLDTAIGGGGGGGGGMGISEAPPIPGPML